MTAKTKSNKKIQIKKSDLMESSTYKDVKSITLEVHLYQIRIKDLTMRMFMKIRLALPS